jgi:hypothetical protein
MGVDVHRSMPEQMDGLPECLCCTHGVVTAADWDLFVEAMMIYHKVDLAEQPMPNWLR